MFKFTIIKGLYVIITNMHEFKQTFVAYKVIFKEIFFKKNIFLYLNKKTKLF